MKALIKGIASIVIFVCITTTLRAADKPTIAVMPFIVDETRQIDFGKYVWKFRILETEYTHQLMEFLVKSRKFKVLDREHIEKVMRENKLTESDYAKPGEAQRIGKLLVADYLVIGNIDRLEFIRDVKNIQITGETKVELTGSFKLHFRITKVSSGEIVFAQTIKEKLKLNDIPFAERKEMTGSDFKDKLFRNTSVTAGNMVLEGIYPVKIASITEEGLATLNRGKGTGIKKGKRYEVFSSTGKAVIDPDTGESLGAEEIKVGVVEVTEVLPKYSKAKVVKVIKDAGTFKKGSICRSMPPEEVEAEPPATPRVDPGF